MAKKKSAFVIAPIGEAESATRKRSDKVLRHIIRPVAEANGYMVKRADEISAPGIITSQVIEKILEDDLVLADLTDLNPNVFYELSLRHAVRKPCIQLLHTGQKVPFDVAVNRTIYFDYADLDSVEDCKRELDLQLKAIEEQQFEMYSPISTALDLKAMRGGSSQEKWNAEVVTRLQGLRELILQTGKAGDFDEEYDNLVYKIDYILQDIEHVAMSMDFCEDMEDMEEMKSWASDITSYASDIRTELRDSSLNKSSYKRRP